MLTKDEVVELEEVSFTFYLVFFKSLSVDTLYLPSPKKGQTIHGCDCRCYKSAKTIVFPI